MSQQRFTTYQGENIFIDGRCYEFVDESEIKANASTSLVVNDCNICEAEPSLVYENCDFPALKVLAANDYGPFILWENDCWELTSSRAEVTPGITTQPARFNSCPECEEAKIEPIEHCSAIYTPCGGGSDIIVQNNTENCVLSGMPSNIITNDICYFLGGSSILEPNSVIDVRCAVCTVIYEECGSGSQIIVPNNTPEGESCTITHMPTFILVGSLCYQLLSVSDQPITHNIDSVVFSCEDPVCGVCTSVYSPCTSGDDIIISNNTPQGEECTLANMPPYISYNAECYTPTDISFEPATVASFIEVSSCSDILCTTPVCPSGFTYTFDIVFCNTVDPTIPPTTMAPTTVAPVVCPSGFAYNFDLLFCETVPTEPPVVCPSGFAYNFDLLFCETVPTTTPAP